MDQRVLPNFAEIDYLLDRPVALFASISAAVAAITTIIIFYRVTGSRTARPETRLLLATIGMHTGSLTVLFLLLALGKLSACCYIEYPFWADIVLGTVILCDICASISTVYQSTRLPAVLWLYGGLSLIAGAAVYFGAGWL